jgi:ribosome-associated protein
MFHRQCSMGPPYNRDEIAWDGVGFRCGLIWLDYVDHNQGVAYTQMYYSHFVGGGSTLNSAEVAQLVVEVASEKLAEDIVMLDLRQVVPFADYFVIMSAESSRQIEALEEDLTNALEESGIRRFHREGAAESGWVLLDFSDVIVHIFGPEEREYYQLERLWSRAPQVVRVL